MAVNKVCTASHHRPSQSIVSIPHVCQYFYLVFVRKMCTLAGLLMTLLCGQTLTGVQLPFTSDWIRIFSKVADHRPYARQNYSQAHKSRRKESNQGQEAYMGL